MTQERVLGCFDYVLSPFDKLRVPRTPLNMTRVMRFLFAALKGRSFTDNFAVQSYEHEPR